MKDISLIVIISATSELYFNGAYDLLWKRIDKLNFDPARGFKMQTINPVPTASREFLLCIINVLIKVSSGFNCLIVLHETINNQIYLYSIYYICDRPNLNCNSTNCIFFLACKTGLYTLPSGAKYCRVNFQIQRGFNEADTYCKSIGLSGLAEYESDEDYVFVAGIGVCKSFLKEG